MKNSRRRGGLDIRVGPVRGRHIHERRGLRRHQRQGKADSQHFGELGAGRVGVRAELLAAGATDIALRDAIAIDPLDVAIGPVLHRHITEVGPATTGRPRRGGRAARPAGGVARTRGHGVDRRRRSCNGGGRRDQPLALAQWMFLANCRSGFDPRRERRPAGELRRQYPGTPYAGQQAQEGQRHGCPFAHASHSSILLCLLRLGGLYGWLRGVTTTRSDPSPHYKRIATRTAGYTSQPVPGSCGPLHSRNPQGFGLAPVMF